MKRVAFVVAAVAAAHALAFRENLSGSPAFFWYLAGAYCLLVLLALHFFWVEGTLVARLSPRWGDLSIGALSAIVLLLASWVGRSALAPAGTPRQAWLFRIYLHLGDPELIQNSLLLTFILLFIAAAEEIVWRGMVLDLVVERLGSRTGWIATTFLYALSMVPTIFSLRDVEAGPNPLLVTAALGAGLIWGFLAARIGRVPPVAVSHMAFTYFSAVQFRWPS